MSYQIAIPADLRIGSDTVAQIPEVLDSIGCARPLIVTDAFMTSSGITERVAGPLRGAGAQVAIFDAVVPDPTTDSLTGAIELARAHRADCVIGVGGGSSMDSAKAVGVLANSELEMRAFKAPTLTNSGGLPIIAIPTTAGSGSEATRYTVITDSSTQEKMLCPGLAFLPVAAIIDAGLTATMPPRLTADTGVDALTHAVEAYVSRRANPFSDAMALTAIGSIAKVLRRAYADGSDTEAREHMMLAATQAGIAFSNASVALVHGMSRPLGAQFHLSHGLSNAMLFPEVTEFSLSHATDRYADCARAYGVAGADHSDADAASRFVAELRQLNTDLDVPTPRVLEIDAAAWRTAVPTMAEQALASGSPANNPRVPTALEIEDIYDKVFAG